MARTYIKGIGTVSTATGATVLTLASTAEEPKTLTGLKFTSSITNTVTVTGYLEREKIIDSVDMTVFASTAPIREFLLNLDIPAGQTFTLVVADKAAGSTGTLYGWAEYQIKE